MAGNLARVIYNITITTMPLLESILSVIAPHDCLGCGQEGAILCDNCAQLMLPSIPERCYICHGISANFRTCSSCRRKSSLYAVFVRTRYEGVAKDLVGMLKFNRVYAGGKTIAGNMHELIPGAIDCVLVPVPTATVRRRQRGYDQSELITTAIARQAYLPVLTPLSRRGQTRQVGTKRAERLAQLQDAFFVPHPHRVAGMHVLLVDDVLTTGATLESAARVLRGAGARRVSAIVFAQA